MSLIVQINEKAIHERSAIKIGQNAILVTPPIGENYWLMRVAVSEKQAIVCFPKFFTIGIGFQHEQDWNTNLPYTCDANEIYNHIKHNKSDDEISDSVCLDAIRLIQEKIKTLNNKE